MAILHLTMQDCVGMRRRSIDNIHSCLRNFERRLIGKIVPVISLPLEIVEDRAYLDEGGCVRRALTRRRETLMTEEVARGRPWPLLKMLVLICAARRLGDGSEYITLLLQRSKHRTRSRRLRGKIKKISLLVLFVRWLYLDKATRNCLIRSYMVKVHSLEITPEVIWSRFIPWR